MATLRRRSTRNGPIQFSVLDGTSGSDLFRTENASGGGGRNGMGQILSSCVYKLLVVVGLVLIIVPWIHHSDLNRRIKSLMQDISLMQDQQEELLVDIQNWSDMVQKKKKEAMPLEEDNNKMLLRLQALGDTVDTGSNIYIKHEKVEEAYLARIDQLETTIKKRSIRDLVIKYGEGPYYINVTLTEETGASSGRWFVIETAPNSLMPHAVDLFTRMAVEYKLWDGLTLLQQAGSNLIHTMSMSATNHAFLQHHFDSVDHLIPQLAYTEHAPEFPIEKYSVSFSGRPGGPHIYINMNDELNLNEIDPSEACFGKVIHGREVVDRIMENRESLARKLLMYGIESMRMTDSLKK